MKVILSTRVSNSCDSEEEATSEITETIEEMARDNGEEPNMYTRMPGIPHQTALRGGTDNQEWLKRIDQYILGLKEQHSPCPTA